MAVCYVRAHLCVCVLERAIYLSAHQQPSASSALSTDPLKKRTRILLLMMAAIYLSLASSSGNGRLALAHYQPTLPAGKHTLPSKKNYLQFKKKYFPFQIQN